MDDIASIHLTAKFGRDKVLFNHFKAKRFVDGNVFIKVKNGWDREKDKERSCCIVLNRKQIEELMEFLK